MAACFIFVLNGFHAYAALPVIKQTLLSLFYLYIHYCADLYMNVYCKVYEVTHDRAVYIDYCTDLYMNVYCRVYEVTHDRAVYTHYCTDLYMNVYCRVYEVTHDSIHY